VITVTEEPKVKGLDFQALGHPATNLAVSEVADFMNLRTPLRKGGWLVGAFSRLGGPRYCPTSVLTTNLAASGHVGFETAKPLTET